MMFKIERKPSPLFRLRLQESRPEPAARSAYHGPTVKKPVLRIAVWSDYVCPFCYLEEPILNRIAQEYKEHVIMEWRAFELRPDAVPTLDPDCEYLHAIWNRAVYPMAHLRGMKLRLPPLQPRSRRALEAAEFARSQGRFPEMHTSLFRAFFQEGLDLNSLPVLLQIGASVGLDTVGLRFALETGRYTSKVNDDERLAREIAITGVPTLVLSKVGHELEIESIISGAQPYELVRAAVERLLNG